MNLIHLDLQGKTARVLLQLPPAAKPKPATRQSTSAGVISPFRIVNGLNPEVDPVKVTSQDRMSGDPELALTRAGEILDADSLTAAYFDPSASTLEPVGDFTEIDVVYDATGQEKERRAHITRKSNLDDLYPIKIGKRLPLAQALTGFAFKQICQIVHEDGVQKDFLYTLAKELHDKQEIAILGGGAKGNLPLVVRDRGNPYRAFLYGEIGTGEDEGKYKLLLLLSDQELKRPESSAV